MTEKVGDYMTYKRRTTTAVLLCYQARMMEDQRRDLLPQHNIFIYRYIKVFNNTVSVVPTNGLGWSIYDGEVSRHGILEVLSCCLLVMTQGNQKHESG